MAVKYEDFLNELVVLEKKYLLYSHGHDFVNQAVLDLLRTIGEIHSTTPNIKIIDTGFSLIINGVEFSADNIRAGYIMQLLGGRGITSVTFCSGVGFSPIIDFLYLLNAIPTNSKLLYHTDIQYAIHNIDSIIIEEMDYSSLRYGYQTEIQDVSSGKTNIRSELIKSLKTFNPLVDRLNTDELIDIALEELSKMSENEASDFLKGLPYEAISVVVARANVKKNSISPSLVDLLVAMDLARKLAGGESLETPDEGISDDQINKLVEREAYELYVTEDYRQHLRSLLSYDAQSDNSINGFDLFDSKLINRTIATALLHLVKNNLDSSMHMSFLDSIHKYLDEFIDSKDWQFIHSFISDERVRSYLNNDSTVSKLSQVIRASKSYSDNNLQEVINASGPKNLGWLIDAYIDEEDLRTRRRILVLIQSFQEKAAIQAVRKYIGDPTRKISIFIPMIDDNLDSIPKELAMKLYICDSADAKFLALRILLTQNDDKIINEMKRLIQAGNNEQILILLDLIKEFRISEVVGTLVERISTFYIDDNMYKYIVRAIDTISWIDPNVFQDLYNRLMNNKLTLSPKKLSRIKRHLKGVSHDNKSR